MSSSNLVALAAAGLAALGLPAVAAEDLAALEVVGQRGQSLEQTRRDRYECHNWAVEQTGETPTTPPPRDEARSADRELRRERVERALAGAALGAGVGSILTGGRRHDAAERVLVGAAAGAAIGAATARGADRDDVAEPEGPSEYLRALSACLEGRGYSVRMPTAADLTASR